MNTDYLAQPGQGNPTSISESATNLSETSTNMNPEHYEKDSTDVSHEARKTNEEAFSPNALSQTTVRGKWGPQDPSNLFLQIFEDALACLDKDPLCGMVSRSLMGSYGTVPLTVISPLVDIVRHMSNLIVRAEQEVILISCVWSPSFASHLISDALKELSARASKRQQRVTVKVMYDKAGPAHMMNPRQQIKPEVYSGNGVQLPKPDEMPNLDFEAISFHKPLLGTLHAKFMVVDRKIAIVQSNNMEDNVNMEMMTQLEGPIVDSIYDTALITLGDASRPTLPNSKGPGGTNCLSNDPDDNEPLYTDRPPGMDQAQVVAKGEAAHLPEHMAGNPHYDPDIVSETLRMQSAYSRKENESHLQAINRQLNIPCKKTTPPSGPDIPSGSEFTPYITTSTPSPFPIALVSRPPFGAPNNSNTFVPQNEAWLSSIRNAKQSIFIQTPDLNATQLHSALLAALRRGVEVTYYVCLGYNDAGEVMPGQGGTNEMFATKLTAALTSPAERELLHICYYVAKDQNKPIHHSFARRSCHIKLLIVDGHIGIQGSGNQDTQSWCHSQEINVLIDSEEVCGKWREGIERNQNTARFGRAAEDGIWRDDSGKEAEGSMGMVSAPVGWVKGAIGMVKKARASGNPHA